MSSVTKPSRRASVRQAKYAGRHTLTIDADTSELDELIASMKENVQAALRPAAQAAAEVLYQAVRQNVAALGSKTGNLYASIYQAYSESKSGPDHATYHVSWRTSKDGLPRAPHGHLVEYGHIQKYKVYLGKDGHWYTNKKAPLPTPVQVAARPFVRPAAARFPDAVEAATKKFLEVIDAGAA